MSEATIAAIRARLAEYQAAQAETATSTETSPPQTATPALPSLDDVLAQADDRTLGDRNRPTIRADVARQVQPVGKAKPITPPRQPMAAVVQTETTTARQAQIETAQLAQQPAAVKQATRLEAQEGLHNAAERAAADALTAALDAQGFDWRRVFVTLAPVLYPGRWPEGVDAQAIGAAVQHLAFRAERSGLKADFRVKGSVYGTAVIAGNQIIAFEREQEARHFEGELDTMGCPHQRRVAAIVPEGGDVPMEVYQTVRPSTKG
jgi:hypothetical protein